MIVRRTAVLSALALPLAAVTLIGCSSDSKTTTTRASGSATSGSASASASKTSADLASLSADALLTKSEAALTAANQVRIKGKGADSGMTIGLDLSFKGKDSTGDITISGGKLSLLSVSGSTYLKGTDAFWKATAPTKAATIIEVTKGKWLKIDPTNAQYKELVSFIDHSKLGESVLKPDGAVSKGPAATVNGVPCLSLKSGTGTLYVAKDDARPIQVDGTGANDDKLAFSYSDVTIPSAPAAANVIDASKLGG